MRPKVYLFGDSITEFSFENGGWGAALADHFRFTADVVLRGYSGYNTRWALRILDKAAFPAEECAGSPPLAVTVFFGANDASLPDRSSAFQHVPVDEYQNNLRSIVSFFKERWPTVLVILLTPPPIDEAARIFQPFGENKSGRPERTNEAAGAYAKACIDVASEFGVPSVDLWTKVQQVSDWKKTCLSDGLHLARAGNSVVFDEVVNVLKKQGRNAESLPSDFPIIDKDIDPNDPLKSF